MIYDCIIIGAGPSALSAAIYLKNANKNILVIEKSTPGGKILKANKINNYLGFNNIEPATMAYKMYVHTQELGINIIIESVIKIEDGKEKQVITNKNKYKSKSIIIACGRNEKLLNIENEDCIGISYCAKCDGSLYKDKAIAFIGNNLDAIDDCIYLSNIVKHIVYINYSDEDITFNNKNIDVINNEKIVKINKNNNIIESVLLSNGDIYKVSGLFIENGYTPNAEFIKNLDINTNNGFIVVDKNMKTNIDGIYAIGDIIYKDVYQIITAAAEGTISALSVIKYIR